MSKNKNIAVSRIASDFEFVKRNNRAYIRSAVFLPLPGTVDSGQHHNVHPPNFIVTVKPEVIVQFAHTLPAGNAMRKSHGSILQATREMVDKEGLISVNQYGNNELSRSEKELHDQGRTLLREITSELCGKHVFCIPNIHSIPLPSPLGHHAFGPLHDRVVRTGSHLMRSCIERLATLSELCTTQDLKLLKKSYFLRIIMIFLSECFICSQTELERAHTILTQGRLGQKSRIKPRLSSGEKPNSAESPIVRVASSIPEVGKHLAEYLISEHKSCHRVVLYFYGSSDIHALIATLESYQRGITTKNKAIREIIFQAVDFTNHPLFDPIYRYSGNRIPKLHDALSSLHTINGNKTYLSFLNNLGVMEYIESSDHHNPIWDTQALACIVLACEWLAKYQKV
ncbi:scarecrow-like protein [Perkinsela sp. CCAP 1560/4]|nr:scarecrow-like protein [Perkinsela sp. CCAP 1560/4]|eukprot:KNH05464.1 scarecrow-like protein [Perkinsela sp. CCAP 1560/4]